MQHLFFDIEPNLIAPRTFLQSNHDKWSINGKANNQAFKWYPTGWIQIHQQISIIDQSRVALLFLKSVNVGSLSLMVKVNDRNIWLRFKVKLDAWSLYLAEKVNDHNIGNASAHPSKYCWYWCFCRCGKISARFDVRSDYRLSPSNYIRCNPFFFFSLLTFFLSSA